MLALPVPQLRRPCNIARFYKWGSPKDSSRQSLQVLWGNRQGSRTCSTCCRYSTSPWGLGSTEAPQMSSQRICLRTSRFLKELKAYILGHKKSPEEMRLKISIVITMHVNTTELIKNGLLIRNALIKKCILWLYSLIANEPGERRREPGEAAASQSQCTCRKQGEIISTWM